MKRAKPAKKSSTRKRTQRRQPVPPERQEIEPAAPETSTRYTSTGPHLSAGDVDADWQHADSIGEEAVGGSVATPDQDVVDEVGRALGVEQEATAEVTMSEDILRRRDRLHWHLERNEEERRTTEEQRAEESPGD
jgi:hypothetical protein